MNQYCSLEIKKWIIWMRLCFKITFDFIKVINVNIFLCVFLRNQDLESHALNNWPAGSDTILFWQNSPVTWTRFPGPWLHCWFLVLCHCAMQLVPNSEKRNVYNVCKMGGPCWRKDLIACDWPGDRVSGWPGERVSGWPGDRALRGGVREAVGL